MNDWINGLKEVDRVEVLTLMDNFSDVLLTDTEIVKRPPRAEGEEVPTDTFLAEHGLCLHVTVFQGDEEHTLLLDTGYTKVGVLHNIERLGLDIDKIEAIVLSHAHMDHTGSLYPLIERLSSPIPIVVHPGAFLPQRWVHEKDGTKRRFPRTLVRDELLKRSKELIESENPTLIADGMVLVTGEVERTTGFEKGVPNAFIEREGKMEPDPISDDQALVVRLKDRGLVIIAGCSHAGIVNTAHYAKKLTNENNIHAILGGFHLSGPFFEKIIDTTVNEIKALAPEVIVPMHCTGRSAMNRFSEAFDTSFILNSVGSRIVLKG